MNVHFLISKLLFCMVMLLMCFYSSEGHGMELEKIDKEEGIRNPLFLLKQEELDQFSATQEKQTKEKGWFVKHIIAEIPVVGYFFHHSPQQAFRKSGKSIAMLVGGSLAMMYNFSATKEQDNEAVQITKGSINMAIGMSIAGITYNILCEGTSYIYKNYLS